MATIQSQLSLVDGVSGVLRRIDMNMKTLRGSFTSLQSAADQGIHAQNFEAAAGAIDQMEQELKATASALQAASDRQIGFNSTVSIGENEINRMKNTQNGFNASVRAGTSAADGLLNKVKGIVATIAAASGIKNLIRTSDQLAGSAARLSLIVDDGGSVEELQRKIFASAQASRGAYTDVMDTVGKLGLTASDAFTGNDEMIRFAQLMNQNFIIAGASASEQSSAMYQLTQAMASGRLQGDEYRSIIENAPLLAGSIEDYMRNVQGATGTMKDWASEGLLTSDVIKAALFSSADEIETRFAEMPRTWSQNWTMMKNNAVIALQPLYNYINQLANDPRVMTAISSITTGIAGIAQIAIPFIDAIVNGLTWVGDNLEWLLPILAGVAAVYVILNTVTAINNVLQGVAAVRAYAAAAASVTLTAAEQAETMAKASATAAQHGFNAALMACPLTWIILLIIAVIAAIVAVCNWIAKTTGAAQTGFGVITGGINVAIQAVKNAGLVVANVALGIWSALGAVCSNIGIAFHNVIANVQGWFYGLLSTVLTVVSGIAAALNSLPFVSFDYSGITAKADEYAAKSAEAYGSVEEYKSVGDAFSEGFNTFETFTDGWAADAFQSGAAWGDGVMSGLSDTFSFDADSIMGDYGTGTDMSGYQPSLDGIDGNTGSAAASLKNMSEDVAYMRDVAEREAINRFTTAELHVDMTGMTNRIENDMDVDGVINRFVTGVTEALDVAAEGVHQ